MLPSSLPGVLVRQKTSVKKTSLDLGRWPVTDDEGIIPFPNNFSGYFHTLSRPLIMLRIFYVQES